MPTPLDVLKQLTEDVRVLTARVKVLEGAPQAFDWNAPVEFDNPWNAPVEFDNPEYIGTDLRTPERQATITDGEVVLTPANAQQNALRLGLVYLLELENLPPEHGLDKSGAERAYLAGGPMWLYHFDREFLMSLSADVRRAMVDDVAAGGHQLETQEFARDVLKSDDPRRAAEVDLEHAGRAMEKRQ